MLLRASNNKTVFIVWLIVFIAAFVGYLAALSYVYASSGLFHGRNTSVETTESRVDVKKDATISSTNSVGPDASIANQSLQATPASPDTEVHINGTFVPLSDNGTLHKDVSSDGNNASIDVHIQSSGSNSSESHSSVKINVNSTSDVQVKEYE